MKSRLCRLRRGRHASGPHVCPTMHGSVEGRGREQHGTSNTAGSGTRFFSFIGFLLQLRSPDSSLASLRTSLRWHLVSGRLAGSSGSTAALTLFLGLALNFWRQGQASHVSAKQEI
ncbi:hypothetical protein NDU88_003737 [Pleurodeles waltl]|uniref:Uncharacterized protein n=1 Tax=Pleurodeles waltl TaxID=8319 RepID=A0AAV7MRG2_PLEWA|nr:hypothetical protein NDU88_003737 [Pleurodeles waltl]